MKKEMELKELIERKGYSLRSFAEKINLPYTTLISMLNSGINKSSVDNVLKVYNGLGITIEELEDNFMNKLNEAAEELEDYGYEVDIDMDKTFEISIGKDGNFDYHNVFDFTFGLPNSLNQYIPNTEVPEVIAAHFDGDMTDEDIEEISKFIEFVKSKK